MNRSPSFPGSIKHKLAVNYPATFPLTFKLLYKLSLAVNNSLRILLVVFVHISLQFPHAGFC